MFFLDAEALWTLSKTELRTRDSELESNAEPIHTFSARAEDFWPRDAEPESNAKAPETPSEADFLAYFRETEKNWARDLENENDAEELVTRDPEPESTAKAPKTPSEADVLAHYREAEELWTRDPESESNADAFETFES